MRCALLLTVSLAVVLSGCNQIPSVLKYEIHGDSVTITGCDEDVSGELVIPDTIKGKAVTSIRYRAFDDCSSLTSITIPDSVTSIGEHAFGYCTSLTNITIPDSVTSIGSFAFYRCTNLISVIIHGLPPTISGGAFFEPVTIYVPAGAPDWGEEFSGRPVERGLPVILVAYYPLDGDFQDASGNGNHGTLVGAGTTYSNSVPTSIGGGQSVSFPGITGHYGNIQNAAQSGGLR